MKPVQSVLIRSTSGGFEPRFRLAEELLLKFSSKIEPIIWSRTLNDSTFLNVDSISVFEVNADYGRGWKNLLSHFKFSLFVHRRLRASNPKLIYACDLDTLLPSLIWRMKKNVIIVFDQFDPLASRTNNPILSRLIGKLENFLAKKADIKITANLFRIPSYMRDDWFELKNVFSIDSSPEIFQETKPPFVLFYGGILAPDRGLLACAGAISQDLDWEFHLYGQGSISELLKTAAYPNVFLHEPIPHEELMQVASNSDLFLAMYDPSRSNNKFTASNKLFEAAQLGVPVLTSKDTQLGQIVESNDLGWVVEYDDSMDISSALAECKKLSHEKKLETHKNMKGFSTKYFLERQETANRILELIAGRLEE